MNEDLIMIIIMNEDLIMKREMMRTFEQSNKTLEESISKMTMCLTYPGGGIATGKRMLEMALSNQLLTTGVPHAPRVYHPNFNTYNGFVFPPSYGTPLSRSSVHSQFNRIGNEEVIQSIPGRGTNVGATQTLPEDDSFYYWR